MVASRSSVNDCGRYPTSPEVVIDPVVGGISPAIRRSRVDLPAPMVPTRPVRPVLKLPVIEESATVPSGQGRPTVDRVIDVFL